MESSKLERIAKLLSRADLQDDEDDVQFCMTDELAPTDISIEVDGLGLMTLPVSDECIQKLINISSKAKIGLRELTILDENIRNSYEITSDKLHITINEHPLTTMLSKMRYSLGLSENSVLTAHLHNMLIYGPGMFFDMHQDTEKLGNMVATLVLVLPSPHIGGDLIIKHAKIKHVFSSENIKQSNVKCIGFYADCHHNVEKIKEGYRVSLTYNLVLKPEKNCVLKKVNGYPQLLEAVKDHFDVEVDKKSQNQKLLYKQPQPHKLVYFLNHNYTEHSLLWDMLKGDDRASASALNSVARELNLIPHLALAKIHECWSTRESCGYCNCVTDGDDPDLRDLIDNAVTLSHWIDSNNKKVPFGECNIGEDEICWTKETESFVPYKTHHRKAFMGNEGSSMEYWYKRAAVVLWSESSQIPMNFILNYDSALNELKVLTSSPGNEEKIAEIIAKSGKYVLKIDHDNDEKVFETLANIVLYIKEKDTALSVLSHFDWDILNSDIAQFLAKLQIQYGINWIISLGNNLKHQKRYSKDFSIKEINNFVQNFVSHGGADSIVELLLNIQSNTLMDISQRACKRWLKECLPKRLEMFYQTLQACATVKNTSIVDKIIQHLISNPEVYPVTSLAELYFKLQDVVPSEFFGNFSVLRFYLVKTIDSSPAVRTCPNDDWSIKANFQCECGDCEVAMSFLRSKTERIKIWRIPRATREHINRRLLGLNLPVKLSLERTGWLSSPKLVMEKTELLHHKAQKVHDELKFYQQKLQTDVKD